VGGGDEGKMEEKKGTEQSSPTQEQGTIEKGKIYAFLGY